MFSKALTVRVGLGAAAALGVSVLVAAAVGRSGGTAAPTAATAQIRRERPDVLVVGESLTHQAAPLESRLLEAAGYRPAIMARDSEDLGSPFVQQRVAAAAAASVPIVVLETASNDAYHGAGTAPRSAWAAALARYQKTLSATLAHLSHQCTVLVDTRVADTSPWYGMSRIGPGIDAALEASAQRRPGSVVLVHWAAASAGHGSDWFWSDGLHFGDPDHGNADWHAAGATAFADAITAGVETCSADLGARSSR